MDGVIFPLSKKNITGFPGPLEGLLSAPVFVAHDVSVSQGRLDTQKLPKYSEDILFRHARVTQGSVKTGVGETVESLSKIDFHSPQLFMPSLFLTVEIDSRAW